MRDLFGLLNDNYVSKSKGLWPKVGAISSDHTAIIGREAWAFIYEGLNDYTNQYMLAANINLGVKWAALIATRRAACFERGFNFLQLIVPNKLTLLSNYSAIPLDRDITQTLDTLLRFIEDKTFLAPVELFRESKFRESIFRRNDSHLTLFGNALLTELILESLGYDKFELELSDIEAADTMHFGDLGCKFMPQVAEVLRMPNWQNGFFSQEFVEKISESIVDGNNGTRQVFINRNAPINKCLVVFGNSFFEKNPSWGLSPFFVQLFREYHFVWSPSFDMKYCDQVKPDYVIAQTCERFMTKLPKDII